jgi:nucleotide-binding universal stress UspA family protein
MFQTIVLALDGSPSSDRALDCASEIARSTGGQIHVVHVVEIVAGRGGSGPALANEDEVKEKVRQQVAELVGAGIRADLEIQSAVVGGPAHVIADAAERFGADVVVMGTRGHTVFAGMLLGSVAQRMLHVAPCPVLVVPSGEHRRADKHDRSTAAAAG